MLFLLSYTSQQWGSSDLHSLDGALVPWDFRFTVVDVNNALTEMEKNYTKWKLDDLKAELRRRNARVTGRKKELIDR